jgi:hypothetical protein
MLMMLFFLSIYDGLKFKIEQVDLFNVSSQPECQCIVCGENNIHSSPDEHSQPTWISSQSAHGIVKIVRNPIIATIILIGGMP